MCRHCVHSTSMSLPSPFLSLFLSLSGSISHFVNPPTAKVIKSMSAPPPPPPPLPPTSAEIIGVNDDLLTEILIHLPVKSLLRLKSVNKHFLSTISHPLFSLLHSLRHPHPPPSALFFRHYHSLTASPTPSFSLLPLSPTTTSLPLLTAPPNLLQSTHGLLLSKSDHHIHVSNPTTLRTTRIPSPDKCAGFSFAFDPLRWGHTYHLLMVRQISPNSTFAVGAYCPIARQWADKVARFDAPFDTEFDRGVYWEGRVFWLSHTASMVYYDVDGERVGSLALPRVYDEGAYMERFRYFGEAGGRLHLVEIRTNCAREFEVLEAAEVAPPGGGGAAVEWRVKYRVDLDLVGCGFEEELFQDHFDRFGRDLRFYAFSILAVVVRGEEEGGSGGGDEIVLSVPGKVISYDFKRKVSRLLCNVVDECDKWLPFRGFNAFPFIESLSWV